ncbi:TIGR03759 family integrating conjugative element protein [Lelliottia amnigena]|uniref:TIGR03759 family integrating conjugative element protein n=1 Tax=Lelliottia amnigena TaxID=61646 RepID=UPI0040579AE6
MNIRTRLRNRPTDLLLIALWGTVSALAALQLHAAEKRESEAAPSRLQYSTEAHLAQEWGLTVEDWVRYRQLMQGPLGTYSPHLDPLSALGIEARDNNERRRLAELQVKAEVQRTEKLLAYQRAYDEAWRHAYPHAMRVVLPGAQSSAISGNGRLALFIKEDCPACDTRARALQTAGASFDVYMVGSRQEDVRIQQWAVRIGIAPAKVRSGTITLNHDAGRWQRLGVAGELPALVRETGSGWLRQ